MPPKVKITRDEIIDAALAIVREHGEQAINARTLAAALGCSTQPIFSNFVTMDDLRMVVTARACDMYEEYMQRETERGIYPVYKSCGMAYIHFAKEEKELFKLLYMRPRSGAPLGAEADIDRRMGRLVHANTGLEGEQSKLFHLEMWAYVHGIAVMFATGYLDLEEALVDKILTDAYQGLRKQFGVDENGRNSN